MFSSLRMADGDVYAHELPTGEVRAGHVVLSSCDVGTSQVRQEVTNRSGWPTPCSRWGWARWWPAVAPVPDDETVQVMADYHAALARGLPNDEALAVAGTGSAFVVLGSGVARGWTRLGTVPNSVRTDQGRFPIRSTSITLYYMNAPQRRTLVYSVRLSPQESNAIQKIADARHLPASTLVRAWILDRLEQEQGAA